MNNLDNELLTLHLFINYFNVVKCRLVIYFDNFIIGLLKDDLPDKNRIQVVFLKDFVQVRFIYTGEHYHKTVIFIWCMVVLSKKSGPP